MRPNLSALWRRGRYSVRSRGSVESGLDRFSLASAMKAARARAERTWQQSSPRWESHAGSSTFQRGRSGRAPIQRAIPNPMVAEKPIVMMSCGERRWDERGEEGEFG